jgi:hypothetical protein
MKKPGKIPPVSETRKTNKTPKVSTSHQRQIIEKMQLAGISQGQINAVIDGDKKLFAGERRGHNGPSIKFDGTDMTIAKPSIIFRPRGTKSTRKNYTNVVTKAMMSLKVEYEMKSKKLLEQVCEKYACEYNLSD